MSNLYAKLNIKNSKKTFVEWDLQSSVKKRKIDNSININDTLNKIYIILQNVEQRLTMLERKS